MSKAIAFVVPLKLSVTPFARMYKRTVSGQAAVPPSIGDVFGRPTQKVNVYCWPATQVAVVGNDVRSPDHAK